MAMPPAASGLVLSLPGIGKTAVTLLPHQSPLPQGVCWQASSCQQRELGAGESLRKWDQQHNL